MSADHTLSQTGEDLLRAQQRSLERTRPPLQVPGYEAETFLGAGAYGEVWVATDRNTRRRVAIKFYTHRGGLDWSLLSREVEKLAFLFADRYVVQLIGVGWDADPPYYIMEYLERGSLADRLRQGPLPADEAIGLFREVAIGLVHAHGKGVLHCDLKPANVLLDQDHKPRLADFGQSRLSHEQKPALGTLFYMAPEQADLAAVPDARWDVYGLGALLYCLLSGEPPYRTAAAATLITQATGLSEQLQRYVRLLHDSPRPDSHRSVSGVDRDLGDIVDRCLALNPAKRFPNPQAVLDALNLRDQRRSRRPLLVLGALGPAVLLIVMTLFAWSVASTSVKESEKALVARATQSGRFAAQFVAETVAREVDERWRTLELEAADGEFRNLVTKATGRARPTPERKQLQARVEALHAAHPELLGNSWFLVDATGKQIARSPADDRTLDGYYAYRDYFHGQGHDLPKSTKQVKPIQAPHRSNVYVSDGSETLKTAFTVPIWSTSNTGDPARRVIGVLGVSVELGTFASLRSEHGIAVLVDTREDAGVQGKKEGDAPTDAPQKGLILEHPFLSRSVASSGEKFPDVYLDAELVSRLEELRRLNLSEPNDENVAQMAAIDFDDRYIDPVRGDQAGRWLAEFEPVVVRSRLNQAIDTGWVVIIQEPYEAAVQPARDLGERLVKTGLLALGLVIGVVTALWGFVVILLNESPRFHLTRFLRKKAGLAPPSYSNTGTGSGSLSAQQEGEGRGTRGQGPSNP